MRASRSRPKHATFSYSPSSKLLQHFSSHRMAIWTQPLGMHTRTPPSSHIGAFPLTRKSVNLTTIFASRDTTSASSTRTYEHVPSPSHSPTPAWLADPAASWPHTINIRSHHDWPTLSAHAAQALKTCTPTRFATTTRSHH